MSSTLQILISNGVVIPQPEAVFIGPDVGADRIQSGAILYPGCRITGKSTFIGAGSRIGSEGPAVVNECQIGRNVSLGSGFFDASVFLDGASFGGNAHIRPGCLIEEQAGGAHSVGMKQTVLMSYVTLGSLINFCDCFMSGGTSRKNHSEVGSSYIHFNYTPHQDKATPSMIGDVTRGVLLNQPPIFLGGQGGLVGPTRIAFGTVIPAGQIIRHDVLEPNLLVRGHASAVGTRPYHGAVYGAMDRVVENNLVYIGNIKALSAWYRHVRGPLMTHDPAWAACHQGALRMLSDIVNERIKRLDELAGKLIDSIALLSEKSDDRSIEHLLQQQEFVSRWPAIKAGLASTNESEGESPDLHGLVHASGGHGNFTEYTAWIAGLSPVSRETATNWLLSIVDTALKNWKTKR